MTVVAILSISAGVLGGTVTALVMLLVTRSRR